MNVAELIVRCLEIEGVRHVFGVPGEENEAFLFALDASEHVQFVPTRHEQGAAFIANVWGRVTGRAGVCLSTLGPGATNLITGLADANLDKAPVVAITAQGGLDRLHHESHQALDIVEMFRPITKYNTTVRHPEIVVEVMRKAFKVAQAEKPGVTHVELPEDVARVTVEDTSVLEPRAVCRPAPDPAALDALADLVKDARRPLLLAGNGAIRTRASRELTHLAQSVDLPVVSTFMGKGAISDRLPQSLHTVGLGFRDIVMDAVDRADLVVAVGYDLAELPPERLGDGTRWAHVDIAPAEVYAHYDPEVELICDVAAALCGLAERLEGTSLTAEARWWMDVRERIHADLLHDRLPDDADRLTVPAALHVIRDVLPDEGLLLSDVGSHKMWIARNFPVYVPGGAIISNGLASMGIALPGGIAASLADPDRPVIACMGDGGFAMNMQELETAKRLGVSFACVVFNDDDYGLISWKQRRHRDRSVATRIGNPDLPALARSFGLEGVRASTPRALRDALATALDASSTTVIEVPVDPSANDRLVARLDSESRA